MKWAIILLIVLSLIGSMMWMMPSPRQRFQAKLRLDARAKGFNLSLVKLQMTRATGETEGEELDIPVYRKQRTNLTKRELEAWRSWLICRVTSQADLGLPEGWSWTRGEGVLTEDHLEKIALWLKDVPAEVKAVESNAIHLSLYWTEPNKPDALEELSICADRAIEEKL